MAPSVQKLDYWPLGKEWFLLHYEASGLIELSADGLVLHGTTWNDLTDRRRPARLMRHLWYYAPGFRFAYRAWQRFTTWIETRVS